MQQNADPRKRPLLTAEQLRIMCQGPKLIKKGTPREEFEKLFTAGPLAINGLLHGSRDTPKT